MIFCLTRQPWFFSPLLNFIFIFLITSWPFSTCTEWIGDLFVLLEAISISMSISSSLNFSLIRTKMLLIIYVYLWIHILSNSRLATLLKNKLCYRYITISITKVEQLHSAEKLFKKRLYLQNIFQWLVSL